MATNEEILDAVFSTINEVIGRNTKLLHVSDAQYDEFGRASESVLDRGERYRTELDMRRKSGTVFPAEISVSPISAEKTCEVSRSLLVNCR